MELVKYKQNPYYNIIEYEYINLCERGDWFTAPSIIPFVGDLNKDVLESVELATAEKLIEEAVSRGDYEIYGMDKLTFLLEAQRGSIEGFRNLIPLKEINMAVYWYLNQFNVCHLDFFRDVVNPPVRSIW